MGESLKEWGLVIVLVFGGAFIGSFSTLVYYDNRLQLNVQFINGINEQLAESTLKGPKTINSEPIEAKLEKCFNCDDKNKHCRVCHGAGWAIVYPAPTAPFMYEEEEYDGEPLPEPTLPSPGGDSPEPTPAAADY